MKEKIIVLLKAYLATLGVNNLSTARIDGISDKLAPTITDESTIQAELEKLNGIYSFSDIAKNDDRARTEKAKKPEEKKPEAKTEDAKTENNDVPAWAKELVESNKKLTERLTTMESEKIGGSRKAKLSEKLVNVPDKLKTKILKDFDKMKFETDEEFETYLAETETDVADFVQEKTNESLGKQPKPALSKGKAGKDEASKEEIEAVVKNIM